MERLTEHSKQTSHENGICCTHFRGPECLRVGGNCAMNCKWEEAAWGRLAAYEDTRLTPERCAEFARADAEGRYIVMRDTKQEGVARLRELADADKDGRLVVLPCKVCDTVYLIVTKRARVYMPEFRFIKKSKLTFLNMERILQDFGKTVFLTREEAEKALEAMEDD